MPNSLPPLPPIVLPEKIPSLVPQPKFRLGETVCWRMNVEPDFGHVIGVVYSHEATHQVTGLHYLILLDEQSPSRSFCCHDFAFEADLEPMGRLPNQSEGYIS
ncbi:hypothetical protein [Phormidesmis priestleyi]|uniref:hypothetical protein n=1 Tax=Phormidesmis priestleyi TaxID=268141 RepID=UPI00083A5F7F|nr:hypothetical protein [Phormidesmis priestleyi]